MTTTGRACPASYSYRPEELRRPAQLSCRTLYVAGCLYGNALALETILARAREEPVAPAVVLNGDFHYLDVAVAEFRAVSERAAACHATLGNIEAELARGDADSGCGCGYPPYVPDPVVERSDAIVRRLHGTARRFPEAVRRLAGLPRRLVATVAGERVAVVHGDLESLAGWRLALEAMEPGDPDLRGRLGWRGEPTTAALVDEWCTRADVRAVACTHTGLPFAQDIRVDGTRSVVVNNGTAGMGNFEGSTHGVITRIADRPQPPADSLYGLTLGGLRCDALPVHFDAAGWAARFGAQWPPGSPAHDSYAGRLAHGTFLRPAQAARGNFALS